MVDDSGFIRATQPLRREGIRIDDQAALLATLNRYDRPGLAASAAFALRRLPKNDRVMQELRAAAQTGPETLMCSAIESLVGFGDTTSWVGVAKANLPKLKHPSDSVSVARLLAHAGHFDGWYVVERHIVGPNPITRFSALLAVDAFVDMKDASGRPVDVVQKLESLRSASASKAVQGELANKIEEINRTRRKLKEGWRQP